jgi:hypothetical protein
MFIIGDECNTIYQILVYFINKNAKNTKIKKNKKTKYLKRKSN